MGVITFNGVPSWGTSANSLKIHVSKQPDYEMPEKETETVHIPGRNGDLIFDHGSYQNVDRVYEIWAGPEAGDFKTLASKISKWLHPVTTGYVRLQDTYESDVYRLAQYIEENNIENILNEAGVVSIKFRCKPQRFLLSGETAITISSRTKHITNQENQIALPKILVHKPSSGSNTVTITFEHDSFIQTTQINFSGVTSDIIIDSSIQDCYSIENGVVINRNNYVTFSDYDFPKLHPGDNLITKSDNVSSLEVTPNWFRI